MRVFRIAGEVKALFYLCLVYLCVLDGFDSVSMCALLCWIKPLTCFFLFPAQIQLRFSLEM